MKNLIQKNKLKDKTDVITTRSGITLIEVLVIIAILGIIIGLLVEAINQEEDSHWETRINDPVLVTSGPYKGMRGYLQDRKILSDNNQTEIYIINCGEKDIEVTYFEFKKDK